MTTFRHMPAIAAGALVLAAAPAALAQTPYSQSRPQEQDPVAAILGALFGDRFGVSSSLEAEWSRGRRPLANQRAQFEARIDADLRSGVLSNRRAERLRDRYDELVDLEARYAADGRMTAQERSDLAARYRDFSQRLEDAGSDYQDEQESVADGRAAFDARVDAAVRARTLTRTQGVRLKSDYAALVQVEAGYLRDGRLTAQERDDLNARLDDLDARIGDAPSGGGSGYLDNRTRLANIERAVSRTGSGVGRAEAADILVEVGDLMRLEAAYARSQPSSDDRAYLERRIGELETRARIDRR